MADVLAVVTNYSRPHNIPKIIEALQQQTVPVDAVIVDNSPYPGDTPLWSILKSHCEQAGLSFDLFDYWRFTENHGPPCRFAPVFMDHSHEFTWLIDDDLLPGPRALEYLLETYATVDGMCSAIGEIGRIFNGSRYVRANIIRRDWPREIDMAARCHFFRTEFARHILTAKWALIDRFGDEARRFVSVHDDLLIHCGIQLAVAFPSYLTPKSADEDTWCRKADLPDGKNGGVSACEDFVENRCRIIEMFREIGWESIV